MEITYYVAASLDGYIAAMDGGVDWLSVVDQPDEDYGYADFLSSVERLFMGSKTYEQVLGFGEWPYPDKKAYVFSRRNLKPITRSVKIISKSPESLVEELSQEGIKHVWLVGGASLAFAFRKNGLISKYVISIIPVILGDGIPLLETYDSKEPLELVESKTFEKGLVQLTYIRKSSK